MNARERLIDMIAEHNLERLDVAQMLKVTRDTVDCWLLPNESSRHEEVPEMAVELLEYKLKDRQSASE